MTAKDFKPLLSPSPTPAPSQKPSFQTFIIKDSLTLPTLLALGGVTQALLSILLPSRYALLPLAFLLGRALITTLLSTRRSAAAASPLLANVISGRTTAQLPLPGHSTPSFGSQPAAQPVVAFHLAVHINHPLGLFAPGASTLAAHFQSMSTALLAERDDIGLISTSSWRGTDRDSGNAILMIAYFRDVDGLNRFAHGAVHRAGWDWYTRFVRETGYRHFGTFHETFAAPRGAWETVYVDCAPTLLGAGSVRVGDGAEKDGKEGGESWVRPLVSADHPALRTQAKRLGLRTGLLEAGGEM